MLESDGRLRWLEQQVAGLLRKVADLTARLARAEQQPWTAVGGGGSGGGSSVGYYGCTLSAALAHGSSVAAQTVWKMSGGSRVSVSTNATVYNDGPNAADDLSSGAQLIVAPNDDGTWTATGEYC